MLKVRVIPTMLFKDAGLVKGTRFDSWRRVGSAMQAIKVYNLRQVDELVFLDITATKDARRPDFETVDDLADDCFMPLTVGGGVASVSDVQQLLSSGADKVSINTSAVKTPQLIEEASNIFGRQCIVIAIDAKKTDENLWEIFTHGGRN